MRLLLLLLLLLCNLYRLSIAKLSHYSKLLFEILEFALFGRDTGLKIPHAMALLKRKRGERVNKGIFLVHAGKVQPPRWRVGVRMPIK